LKNRNTIHLKTKEDIYAFFKSNTEKLVGTNLFNTKSVKIIFMLFYKKFILKYSNELYLELILNNCTLQRLHDETAIVP
jgi:hypothetical protein